MQEYFDCKTEALQLEYETQWQELCELAEKSHGARPTTFSPDNEDWLRERRSVQVSIRNMLVIRKKAEDKRDVELLAASEEMKQKYPENVAEGMVWRDYVQDAMDCALELRARRGAQVMWDPVAYPERALSHVVLGARSRYMQWFNEAAGRGVNECPPGFDAVQPETPDCHRFDDAAWARFFCEKGGYGQEMQVDEDGWSPLMHAMQATVHWDQAWRCCVGLIRMMSDDGLRAKATDGRMQGYSVFHMACNGSDREFKRAHLVQILLRRHADIDVCNDKGLTPWLLAVAGGAVDIAVALSQAGCNIFAKTPEGQNAADRCAKSSTQMLTYLHTCQM